MVEDLVPDSLWERVAPLLPARPPRRYRVNAHDVNCTPPSIAGFSSPTPGQLRTWRTFRHRRGRGRTRDGALERSTNMRSIHHRPVHVESRRQVGHWEGGLLVGAGQRSAIATLVERRTRFTILVGLPDGHSARHVGDALLDAFGVLVMPLRRNDS